MALFIVVSLALLLVFAACRANSAREVQPTQEGNKDPYAYLGMLDEVDLQQILHEKTHGQVQVSAFRSKEELVAAVRKIEEREDAEVSFDEQVKAAMQRKAASEEAASVASSSSSQSHRSAAAEGAHIKDNKERNTHAKVVQLMDGDEGEAKLGDAPSHSQQKGRATSGYAGAKKTLSGRPLSAVHKLEILYCTG